MLPLWLTHQHGEQIGQLCGGSIAELAACPSVVDAVTEDYPARLRDFLVAHDAWLLKRGLAWEKIVTHEIHEDPEFR